MGHRHLLLALCGLLVGVPTSVCPAQPADVGIMPAYHGIALFGARSHHMDLLLAILEGEDHPLESAKRLRAELLLRPGQVPKLIECMKGFDTDTFEKMKDADAALKAMDATEEFLLTNFHKVASAKQQTRFEELSCQLAGPLALRLKHYASRLGLSDTQRKSIQDLVNTYTEKAAALHRAGFVVRSPNAEKKLVALARELDEKILALLTEKQRSKWTSFLGKEFDWTAFQGQ